MDIDEREFEVTTKKHVGFIIDAGKGHHMDPAKVEAIVNWLAPTSVKGVRPFLTLRIFIGALLKTSRGKWRH